MISLPPGFTVAQPSGWCASRRVGRFMRKTKRIEGRSISMNQKEETIRATRGLSRISAIPPKARRRLLGLGLTALLGCLLTIWVSRATWQRVEQLEREFAALRADSFYLGVRMHGGIQQLNDTLLRYRLRGDVNDQESFRQRAQELKQWFESNRTNAVTPLERQFFDEVGTVLDDYLNESLLLLLGGLDRSKPNQFPRSYEKVGQQSKQLLDLCELFIAAQRSAFDHFLGESRKTLTLFHRLFKLSVALLLALAVVLVVLVYRGMIVPLRYQLTESQAIIARQEKLAALGVLAAGVAHEIRNPLTAIKFRLFSLRKSLPAAEQDNEDAAVIASEISRLERIVKDFLQFARPSEPALVTVPAQRIAEEVCSLLKGQLEKSGIELKLESAEPAWVRADTQQIKQVLINLIQNAADSIGNGGEITLRVRNAAGPIRKGGPPSVLLEVADDGKGISAEVQQRLFDPFFSTKDGGTGLGLPIAARIVEKHGGQLHYHTERNRGTTFTVVLPSANEHET